MHALHQEILEAKNLPSFDAGVFSSLITEITELLNEYQTNNLSDSQYKLKLSNIYKKCDHQRFNHKQKVENYIKELIILGSKIKS